MLAPHSRLTGSAPQGVNAGQQQEQNSGSEQHLLPSSQTSCSRPGVHTNALLS